MRIKLVIAALLSFCAAKSQVGIGTTNPQATLDIRALPSQPVTSVGILLPTVEELPLPCEEIPNGLIVFYIGLETGSIKQGLYVFSLRECKWKRIIAT